MGVPAPPARDLGKWARLPIDAAEYPDLLSTVYKDTDLPNKPRNFLRIAKSVPPAEMEALRRAVESMARASVIRAERNYLYAEFRTRLMRYVDDVELYYDEKQGLVHVRSASRLGRRDFGVNRNRVEALRALILRERPSRG